MEPAEPFLITSDSWVFGKLRIRCGEPLLGLMFLAEDQQTFSDFLVDVPVPFSLGLVFFEEFSLHFQGLLCVFYDSENLSESPFRCSDLYWIIELLGIL